MGKNKKDTTTQNSSTTYPQWTQDANQTIAGLGGALTSPFINVPQYQVMGLNGDQQRAFDLARQSAQQAYQYGNTPVGNISTSFNAAQVGPMAQASAASLPDAVLGQAQQFNSANVPGHMNPFLESVLEPALLQARRGKNEVLADIGAQSAAAGSFGGSRDALQRGLAERSYVESTNQLVANLMAQGYDKAQAVELANVQMRQQMEIANQNAQNQFALQQGAFDQQASLANAAASNQGTLQQASYNQQANMAGPQLQLNKAQLTDNLKTANLARQQAALQQLLGVGNQRQLFGQTVLDTPYTNLQRLQGVVPGIYNTSSTGTTTSPSNTPSVAQSLVGTGLSLFGFSDEEQKTNKQYLGTDETGIPQYAYDYKADVAEAKRTGQPMGPKRVGPMAQDVEKAVPGSTKRIGGNLAMLMGAA